MPKGTSRPQLTVQHEQAGACVELPYYTENPEPDEVQCALAWYTGAFADQGGSWAWRSCWMPCLAPITPR